MTLEESDHMTATRLYQNNAKVHFNQHAESKGRFGKRLIYGGHIISLARAASFNGLANAFRVLAINGGRHVNPSFAGDTIYAWSEAVDVIELPGRADLGALRLRTIAAKDHPCADFPGPDAAGKYPSEVVLDLDYTILLPRRLACGRCVMSWSPTWRSWSGGHQAGWLARRRGSRTWICSPAACKTGR